MVLEGCRQHMGDGRLGLLPGKGSSSNDDGNAKLSAWCRGEGVGTGPRWGPQHPGGGAQRRSSKDENPPPWLHLALPRGSVHSPGVSD